VQSIEYLKAALIITASGPTAAAVVNYFATRQGNRKEEKVADLVTVCGNGTTREAVIRVFRQLEASGFGDFITGRRGHESRLVWKEV